MSRAVREIFRRHTDQIEPLSLNAAYLDVTENMTVLPTATRVGQTIRQQTREELHLTASGPECPPATLASWNEQRWKGMQTQPAEELRRLRGELRSPGPHA